MKTLKSLIAASTILITAAGSLNAQDNAKGYYKDIFQDSGIMLTSRRDLPVTRFLGLQMESFISAVNSDIDSITQIDTIYQAQIICGSAIDENGVLLYPDGEPRFRMIYMNGGRATKHGATLGEKGRDNIVKFIDNGGSYLGSCAGSFIASLKTVKDKGDKKKEYLGIWPGLTHSTGLDNSYTGHYVEEGSPLLKYADFGGDGYIANVRHNGGSYAMMDNSCPAGTEVLLRYDGDTLPLKNSIHKEVSCWAYKANDTKGRVVLIGSHPEGVCFGEQLELMSAMTQYALEGNGKPSVKAELKLGEARRMYRTTRDNDPAYTRIGDKQYHHFTVNVPAGCDKITVRLDHEKGFSNFDLYLFASYGKMAFMDDAQYKDITLGVDKSIVIDSPKEGTLFISVFCDTTVETVETRYGTQYTGRTDVLNGVPYTLIAE